MLVTVHVPLQKEKKQRPQKVPGKIEDLKKIPTIWINFSIIIKMYFI